MTDTGTLDLTEIKWAASTAKDFDDFPLGELILQQTIHLLGCAVYSVTIGESGKATVIPACRHTSAGTPEHAAVVAAVEAYVQTTDFAAEYGHASGALRLAGV